MEELYTKYKKLLEYFVTHLEYIQLVYNQNHDYSSIKGYNEYIVPIKNFVTTGQGYNGDKIQTQIAKWEEYNGNYVCININNHFGNGYTTTLCYLNWEGTWLNTRVKWNDKKDKITYIYLSKEKKSSAKPIVIYTIDELGLFDNQEPNEKLKECFNLFYKLIIDVSMEKYVKLLTTNKNIVLTGAPGTGKTYLAIEVAKELGATMENDQCMMVQFHPSYDYTDFVEGLRPIQSAGCTTIGFELKQGAFKEFCANALNDLRKSKEKGVACNKYVFIIDEINRGEISKIFGELFFSIDPGYRGERGKVKTQYNNLITSGDVFENGFFVPENVYIIGTMNDIDRNVDSMDFAMRRRFSWIEISCEDRLEMLDDLNELKEEAINRFKKLNNAIKDTEGLNESYHIGPAYFRNILLYKDSDSKWEELWNYHIKGLLFEYIRGSEDIEDKMNKFKKAYDL